MIGRLQWTARFGNVVLPVSNEAGNLNIDDQNVPAIVASVIVPYDAELFEAMDPRQTPVPRVKLEGTYSEWASQPVSAISDYATAKGGTLADLSVAWAGVGFGQLWDISELYGAPFHQAASSVPETMSLDLHIREVAHDGMEMVIDLASDEALLTDWAASQFSELETIRDMQTGSLTRVSTYIDPVLSYVLGYTPDYNVYSTTNLTSAPGDIMNWNDYPSAWDMIRPALEDTDLKLRVKPSGVGFTLERPVNSINNPATHSWLFLDEDVISARKVYSRTGDWYDAALLSSQDGPPNFGYPSARHSRTYRETLRRGMSPSTSMAQNIVTRASNRGQFIDIIAPIQLGVFMRDEMSYAPTLDHPVEPWIIKSVSYDIGTATMRIRGEQRY